VLLRFKEYVLTYRQVREYIGEMALRDERRNVRMATVTAATRTEVMRIGKDDVRLFAKFEANV
jgi:CRP-like cAMP-binding protein